MTQTKLLLAAGLVALALPLSGAARPSATKLTGTVGPGFTISLKKAGKKVVSLPAGSYTFVVSDRASIHNFRVRGPGVNRPITTVAFVGRETVTLRLKKGNYTFYCNPHRLDMFGKFTVK